MSEDATALSDGPCQGCGSANAVPWYADSRLWNEVVGGDPDEEAAGFLCPSCFMAHADDHFTGTPWRITGWRLVPDLARSQAHSDALADAPNGPIGPERADHNGAPTH